MATISVETVGTAETDGSFTVTWTASGGTDNLPNEIFVFKRATLAMSHVATVADLAFPTAVDAPKVCSNCLEVRKHAHLPRFPA